MRRARAYCANSRAKMRCSNVVSAAAEHIRARRADAASAAVHLQPGASAVPLSVQQRERGRRSGPCWASDSRGAVLGGGLPAGLSRSVGSGCAGRRFLRIEEPADAAASAPEHDQQPLRAMVSGATAYTQFRVDAALWLAQRWRRRRALEILGAICRRGHSCETSPGMRGAGVMRRSGKQRGLPRLRRIARVGGDT